MAILKVKTQVREDMRSQVGNKKYHDDQVVEDVMKYIMRDDKVQKIVWVVSLSTLPGQRISLK